MADSKTDIGNRALQRLGAKGRVRNIDTEASTEAIRLREVYDSARRLTLARLPWGFARKRDHTGAGERGAAAPMVPCLRLSERQRHRAVLVGRGHGGTRPRAVSDGRPQGQVRPADLHEPAASRRRLDDRCPGSGPLRRGVHRVPGLQDRRAALPLTQKASRMEAMRALYEKAVREHGAVHMNDARANPAGRILDRGAELMPRVAQRSFAAGEISPLLSARADLAKFAAGLAVAENVIVHAHGGISNRAGTAFVGPVHDETLPHTLMPFKFSDEDAYQLEWGHYTFRIVRNGGYVVEATTWAIEGATAANPVTIAAVGHAWKPATASMSRAPPE